LITTIQKLTILANVSIPFLMKVEKLNLMKIIDYKTYYLFWPSKGQPIENRGLSRFSNSVSVMLGTILLLLFFDSVQMLIIKHS